MLSFDSCLKPHRNARKNSLKYQHSRCIATGTDHHREKHRARTCQQGLGALESSPCYRAGSSAGRVLRSQCRGREFDPPPVHQQHPIENQRLSREPHLCRSASLCFLTTSKSAVFCTTTVRTVCYSSSFPWYEKTLAPISRLPVPARLCFLRDHAAFACNAFRRHCSSLITSSVASSPAIS